MVCHYLCIVRGCLLLSIYSLESANASLVDELHAKELEYEALQEEVKDLNEKVNSARVQHSKELGRSIQMLHNCLLFFVRSLTFLYLFQT